MAHILIMPRQGNTVESCIITDWKVREGDTVDAETIVCEVETDKAAFEVPAGCTGTVLKILHSEGDDVPVLAPIAVIGASGEDWQTVLGTREQGTGSCSPVPPKERTRTGERVDEQMQHGVGQVKAAVTEKFEGPPSPQSLFPTNSISPRARNLAEKEALPFDTLSGTGPGGRIIERDVKTALENRPGLTAAAKAASARAIGPQQIPLAGTGIGGRVTAENLAAYSLSPNSSFPTSTSSLSPEGAITETPIKGIRKIISDRMYQSLAESAQFTLNASAPAQRLADARTRMKNQDTDTKLSKVTINDLVLFAVSRTIQKFPFMNAHKIGDTLKTFERVHLGLAVDTPRGLMVPVIRNASLLPLAQISSEAKRLAAACQNGAARPEEISGSTFTVTNLGNLGITSFTPVLNVPEVAILGVCGIELKPVAVDGNIRFEPHIGFSLTINHQAVDGAPAARFLKALCEAVADIDNLLMR